METVSLTLTAALMMGLVFGAGPCNITCLPYLGPVFLGQRGGVGQAWRTVVPFSLGRLCSYSLLGLVAGSAGQVLSSWLEAGAAGIVLGVMTVLVGLILIRRSSAVKHCSQSSPAAGEQRIGFARPGAPSPMMPLGLFGMGMAMALNPCAPLGVVLLAAAATASAVSGAMLGLAFGVGAVLIPAFIFTFLVAHFGAQIRTHLAQWQGPLERGAGVMLLLLGTATAIGWVQP